MAKIRFFEGPPSPMATVTCSWCGQRVETATLIAGFTGQRWSIQPCRCNGMGAYPFIWHIPPGVKPADGSILKLNGE